MSMMRRRKVHEHIMRSVFAPDPAYDEWLAGAALVVGVGLFAYWAYSRGAKFRS